MNLLQLMIHQKNDSNYAIVNGKEDVLLTISKFTASGSKKDLSNPELLKALNGYVEYKKLNAKIEEIYVTASIELNGVVTDKVARYYLRVLLEIINFQELYEYLKRDGYKAPTTLQDSFDGDSERNAIATRDQTYLTDEYMHLISLIVGIKILIPLIDMLTPMYSSEMLFILLKRELPEFEKQLSVSRLTRFVLEHLKRSSGGEDNLITVSTMVEAVSSTELSDSLMGLLLFKIFPATVVDKLPPSTGNIVSKMFYKVVNKFTGIKSVNDSFTKKKVGNSEASDNAQGMMDSYRQATAFSPGGIEKMRTQYINLDKFARQYGVKDINYVRTLHKLLSPLEDSRSLLHPITIYLCKILMTKVVGGRRWDSPETYPLLERSQVVNLLVVFGAYLKENGHENLVKMFCIMKKGPDEIKSGAVLTDIEKMASINRNTAEELKSLYPVHSKSTNDTDKITSQINEITDSLNVGDYKYLIEDKLGELVRPTKGVREEIAQLILFIKGVNK